MKKEWKMRTGSLLLSAALLFGSISADVCAAAVPENGFGVESSSKTEYAGTVSANDPEEEKHTEAEPVGTVKKEKNTASVSANDPKKEQYHLVEEDMDSVEKWLGLYCPNGFEDLLAQDESWWNNLYDYEREYAEFLTGLIMELDENVYDEQDLSECIRIMESGVPAEKFFRGTAFQELTLEDLKALRDAGGSLEELLEKAQAPGRKSKAALPPAEGEEEVIVIEELVAKVRVTATGYSGTGHGIIYRITLGGVPALCISSGKHCRNPFLYHADPGTFQKKRGPLGYFAKNAHNSGAEYVACQIAAWLFLENQNLSEVNVRSRTQAMINITSRISLNKMINYVWRFYSEAKSYSGEYYEFYSDNENSQLLITCQQPDTELRMTYIKPEEPVDPEEPVEPEIITRTQTVVVTYALDIDKRDWQTGIGLEGCGIEIFENGNYLTSVTTDESGHAEYSVEKTAQFSVDYDGVTMTEEEAWAYLEQQIREFAATPYTYSVKEVTAPKGYVWEPHEESETITGEETAEFHLTDERTLGAVELVKYDIESESEKEQGDAALDGAVYGIYAAENIYHQDKETGILFRKDELVQTAVTGKTPVQNEEGYILNEDGSRHVAEPEKEVAYVDTPGRTLFGDLELGSYYIKEITAPDGYMFDKTVYPVTFTYKDQNVRIEKRNEKAWQADNELTADDNSTSDIVYSGDYVKKQGFRFLKTSDNVWQTELQTVEGAGFSVYLISSLSGVKSGQLTPMGETWTADDIMTFYDYDFTGEKTAEVYRRTGHETWTEGDKLWLEAGARPNEYHVKEMFTDENGYIEAPELPWGMYVVVETTTPANYTSAKPFIVSVTEDGGVLYTDKTKKKIEKTYTREENIRYGDRRETKDREGRILQKQRMINNMITKTHLRVLKVDEEFKAIPGTYIEAEEFVRGTVLKEGAKYRLKCTTLSLSRDGLLALNWKFDGDGYLSFYDQEARQLRGTAENPFMTKFIKRNNVIQDCCITLPQEIPVGTYELEEVSAPAGYVVNGWEQFVQDSSTERINRYEIIDTPFPTMMFTINNGAVFPDGQMGENKYALTDEYGNLTVTVLQENQEQRGIIEITKHGEQLSGIHEDSNTLLDKLEEKTFREIKKAEESTHRDIVFEYEDAPVEGAVFAVIAAEDIYSQEVQKDLLNDYRVQKEQYLIHRKGEVVATITTDKNGWGYAADLYIGRYKIVETTAGDGFVLNTAETEFEITGHDQTVNFDIHTADYENRRQKLQITVEKQDQDTGMPLAGAVYGLYAKEDVMINIERKVSADRWTVKDSPEILCPADTLIATCITDENGKGVFDEDLPLGKYYVRELEAPAGYLTAAGCIDINGCYDSIKGGQNAERQEHNRILKNKKTQTLVSKQALADSSEVAGAVLEIKAIETDEAGRPKKDAEGNYVAETVVSWVSKEDEFHYFYRDTWGYLTEIEKESEPLEGKELITVNGHLVTGLQLDRAYILSERIAPEKYTLAEDIVFKLAQEREEEALTGTVGLYVLEKDTWQRAADDLLVMYDDKEAVDIEKSTIKMTQCGDICQYRVDELKNESVKSLDQFTMTDHLPTGIYLTELWTGTYNEDLVYDVEYMTNKSKEWVCWERGLSTEINHHLQVPEALRTEEEHITNFRICFGTVGGLFERVVPPIYMTYVSQDAEMSIFNEIELTAECNGKRLRDKAETETVLYLRDISGYRARGGKDPLYEIVENPSESTEEEITLIQRTTEEATEEENTAEQEELENLEEEEVPLGMPERDTVSAGDDAPILFFVQSAVTALTGGVILWCFGRKRKGKRKK